MDDSISRQAAIDAIHYADDVHHWCALNAIERIKALPSAEPERKKPDHGYMWICPECGLEVHSDFRRCVRCGWCRLSAERKKGEWKLIDDTEFRIPGYYCSACHCECEDWSKKPTYNFCPNCGVYMKGEEDGQG